MFIQTSAVYMVMKRVWKDYTCITAFCLYCYPRKSINRPGGQGLLHFHQPLRRCSSLTARDWNLMWHAFEMSNSPPPSHRITEVIFTHPPPKYPKGWEHRLWHSAHASLIYNGAILGLIKQMLVSVPFLNTERRSLAMFWSLLGLIRWWWPNP